MAIKYNGTIITDIQTDDLEIYKINGDETVLNAITKINTNFENIAKHGGGPAGKDGADGDDGINGEDGANAEYIYFQTSLGSITSGTHYPSTSEDKGTLFDNIESSSTSSWTYNDNVWTDHPLGVTATKINEFMMMRYRRNAEDGTYGAWIYSEPVLWSHWGEKGMDGDGVEYIFNTNASKLGLPKKSEMTEDQKIIFNIDDFYPGTEWFNNSSNKELALTAWTNAGKSSTSFNTYWERQFDFADLCDGNLNWTDEPTGTSLENPVEYVAIRKSTSETATGKVWGDFSEPAIWSSYGSSTRMFIVYYGTTDTEDTPEKPYGGWWDNITGDKLVFNHSGHEFGPDGWVDDDEFEDGTVVWISTGIFASTGKNLSWSEPVRITGKGGERGRDGSLMEYIYALSEYMTADEHYPSDEDEREDIFDALKNDEETDAEYGEDRTTTYNSTVWHDNAQAISQDNPTEWVWMRYKSSEDDDWTYSAPVIWAHWGEDGTDGDGVEYVYCATTEERTSSYTWTMLDVDSMTENQKLIFQLDDFCPGANWFLKTTNKSKVKELFPDMADALFNAQWNNKFGFSFGSDEWTDNPSGVSLTYPFEYVSVRKKKADSTGKGVWGNFSTPTLWSSYGSGNRTFILYCNMIDGDVVTGPQTGDGWWDRGNDELVTDKEDYEITRETAATQSSYSDVEHYGYWEDDNETITIEGKTIVVWMVSGIFSSDGSNLSWSKPVRITGENGINGTDGTNIQFIYTVEDAFDNIKYPTETSQKNLLFTSVNSLSLDEYTDTFVRYPFNTGSESEDGVDDDESTLWYDNALEVTPEHPTVWVWTRTRTGSSGEWTYSPKPVIWAHWGEDGTDGDGIEYVFVRRMEDGSESEYEWGLDNKGITDEDSWNAYWEGIKRGTDIEYRLAQFILCLNDLTNDFYPGYEWFTESNKTEICNRLLDSKYQTIANKYVSGLWKALTSLHTDYVLTKDILDKKWESVKNLLDLDFTDNAIGPDTQYVKEYVSIRKFRSGAWKNYSYPSIWAVNMSTEVNTAFAITYPDFEFDDDYRPEGLNGTIGERYPDADVIGTYRITWASSMTPTTARPQLWMTTCTIKSGSSDVIWSKPVKIGDTVNFNVEWSSTNKDWDEVEIINTALNAENNAYNFKNFLDDVRSDNTKHSDRTTKIDLSNYEEVEAEAEYRWRSKMSDDFGIDFTDKSSGAVLMATCRRTNGQWSDWDLVRIKGDKGDTGTSINIKGTIMYEIPLDSEDVYEFDNSDENDVLGRFEEWLNDNNVSNPAVGTMAVVVPCNTGSDYDEDVPFRGYAEHGCLEVFVFVVNGQGDSGSWMRATENNMEIAGKTLQAGDTYITADSGHFIVFDKSDSSVENYTGWIDSGKIKGESGDSYKNVTIFANVISDITDEIKTAVNSWYENGKKESDLTDDIKDIARITEDEKYIYIKKSTGSILDAYYMGNCTFNLNDEQPIIQSSAWTWTGFHGQDALGTEVIYLKLAAGSDNPRCPSKDLCSGQTELDYWEANSEKYDFLPLCQGNKWLDDSTSKSSVTGYVDIFRCYRQKQSNGSWSAFKGEEGYLYDDDDNVLDKWGNILEENETDDDGNVTSWKVTTVGTGTGNTKAVGDESTPVMVQYAVKVENLEQTNKLVSSTYYYLALAKKANLPADYKINTNGSPKSDWTLASDDEKGKTVSGFGETKKYLYRMSVDEYTYTTDEYTYTTIYTSPELIFVYASESATYSTQRWFLRSNSDDDLIDTLYSGGSTNPFPTSGTGTAGVDYWTTDKIGFTINGMSYSYIWCIDDIIINSNHNYSYPYVISRSVAGKDGDPNISLYIDNPSDVIDVDDDKITIAEYKLVTNVHLYKGTEEIAIKAKTDGTPDISVYGDPEGTGITTTKEYINSNKKGVKITITIPKDTVMIEEECNCRISVKYYGSEYYALYKISVDTDKTSWFLHTSAPTIHLKYDGSVEPEKIKVTIDKVTSSGTQNLLITGDSIDYKVFFSGDGTNWKEYKDLDDVSDGEITLSGSSLLNSFTSSGKLQVKLIVPVNPQNKQWTIDDNKNKTVTPSPSAYCIYQNYIYTWNANTQSFGKSSYITYTIDEYDDFPTSGTISAGVYGVKNDGSFEIRTYIEGATDIDDYTYRTTITPSQTFSSIPTTWSDKYNM